MVTVLRLPISTATKIEVLRKAKLISLSTDNSWMCPEAAILVAPMASSKIVCLYNLNSFTFAPCLIRFRTVPGLPRNTAISRGRRPPSKGCRPVVPVFPNAELFSYAPNRRRSLLSSLSGQRGYSRPKDRPSREFPYRCRDSELCGDACADVPWRDPTVETAPTKDPEYRLVPDGMMLQ